MTTSFPPEDRDSGPDGTNGTDENSIPEGTPSATDRDPLSGVEQPDLGHQHQPAGPTPDILDLIAQFATAKGVPPNKLFNALQSLGLDSPRMTLREAVEKVWDELADWTKGKALQRLLDGEAMTIVAGELVQGFAGLGDVPIDEITTARLQCLQKDIRRYVGAIEAAQHRAAQRLARSYDGRDFGHGAERTFVETTTRVFAVLTYRGFVDINPAAALGGGRTGLRKPKPAVLRRAAEDTEINNAFQVVYLECYDYELDAFYWQALLRSGARRAGMLGLRLGGIDLKNCELTTHQKYGVAHTRPVARSILRGIRDLAIARGAESDDDFAFRMKNGKPMTRRHVDGIFAKVQQSGVLPRTMAFSSHVFRHTCLTWIEETSGVLMARAWAGHAPGRLGTVGTYIPNELAPARYRAAAEATFGPLEDEPLGASPWLIAAGGHQGTADTGVLHRVDLFRSPRLRPELTTTATRRPDEGGDTGPTPGHAY